MPAAAAPDGSRVTDRAQPAHNAFLTPALFLLAVGALAVLLYRPYQHLPFDFVDFSEFIPILRDSSSLQSRMDGLTAYYASQGRGNLLQYALIDVSWSVFGDWSPGWQWLRFGTMLAVVVLSYRLLERLGARSWGAIAGASVFLVAPAASTGWIRLTMGEPVATVFLICTALLVLGDASWLKGWARWCVVAILLGLIVLAKEILLASFVLPLAISTMSADNQILGPPRIRPVTRHLLALSVAIAGLAIAWTLSILLRAPSEAYASSFGQDLRPWDQVLAWWVATLLPFDPAGGSRPIVGVALIAFLALMVAGWLLRFRRADRTASIERMLLVIAIGFPLIGVLLYVPWPKHEVFYSIPFLIGSAILAALGLSACERHSNWMATLGYTLWFSLLMLAGADAAAQARRVATRQLVIRELVGRLGEATAQVDTVYVASDAPIPQNWQKLGATIRRYGVALDLSMPAVIDASCDDTRARLREDGVAAVFFSSLCPNPTSDRPIVRRFQRISLPSPRLRPDSLRVDLILPERERPANRTGN